MRRAERGCWNIAFLPRLYSFLLAVLVWFKSDRNVINKIDGPLSVLPKARQKQPKTEWIVFKIPSLTFTQNQTQNQEQNVAQNQGLNTPNVLHLHQLIRHFLLQQIQFPLISPPSSCKTQALSLPCANTQCHVQPQQIYYKLLK